jgi:F-type H+-transporting ATPase subunit gamma
MAGGQERILRNRIRAVQATKKITRAMELIAASRIVKAQQRVHAAVPYSEQITAVVRNLSEAGASSDHPILLGRPEVHSICYLVIAADRGLCGGYNSGVLRAAESEIKADVERGWTHTTVAVGRKAESYLRFRGYPMDRVFTGFSENPTYADAKRIADHVAAMYTEGRVDRVEIVYTRFVSAGSQEVVQRPIIPLEWQLDAEEQQAKPTTGNEATADYVYEPEPTEILDTLVPRYVEARIYAALLNAAASEQAFRQRAMKAATDNADELIKTLSRVMNRARQDAITTEIREIVGGAEALGADKRGDDSLGHLIELLDPQGV